MEEQPQPDREGIREKLVYVVPEQAFGGPSEDEISLWELWEILWQRKSLIFVITGLFTVGSIAYALTATEWYRAEALLIPAEAQTTPSLGGELGGLAALAGVSLGGGESAESVATLKSRALARTFIEANGLMPVLFHDEWDQDAQEWTAQRPGDIPDIRDAIEFFQDDVLSVQEARDTGLVSVSIEWIDPEVAAGWVSMFVDLANQRLRQRALEEAETNVAFLRSELGETNVVTLQQSIGRLLETELQKLMLARGNREFAFRTVDAAEIPNKRSRPRRGLVVVIGALAGGMLSVVVVFMLHAIGRSKSGQ